MRNSAYRWFIDKKARISNMLKLNYQMFNIFEFSRV